MPFCPASTETSLPQVNMDWSYYWGLKSVALHRASEPNIQCPSRKKPIKEQCGVVCGLGVVFIAMSAAALWADVLVCTDGFCIRWGLHYGFTTLRCFSLSLQEMNYNQISDWHEARLSGWSIIADGVSSIQAGSHSSVLTFVDGSGECLGVNFLLPGFYHL